MTDNKEMFKYLDRPQVCKATCNMKAAKVVSGKRKSQASDANLNAALKDAQVVFKRHFEAQFKPLQTTRLLEKTGAPPPQDPARDAESSGSEWEGISEDEKNGTASSGGLTASKWASRR
jgi:hypothetical protein